MVLTVSGSALGALASGLFKPRKLTRHVRDIADCTLCIASREEEFILQQLAPQPPTPKVLEQDFATLGTATRTLAISRQ